MTKKTCWIKMCGFDSPEQFQYILERRKCRIITNYSSLTYKAFAYITFFSFCVIMKIICLEVCRSLHLRFYFLCVCAFPLVLYFCSFICFVLFLIYFMIYCLYIVLYDCFLMRESKQGCEFEWKMSSGGSGWNTVRGIIIKIYCMKKI